MFLYRFEFGIWCIRLDEEAGSIFCYVVRKKMPTSSTFFMELYHYSVIAVILQLLNVKTLKLCLWVKCFISMWSRVDALCKTGSLWSSKKYLRRQLHTRISCVKTFAESRLENIHFSTYTEAFSALFSCWLRTSIIIHHLFNFLHEVSYCEKLNMKNITKRWIKLYLSLDEKKPLNLARMSTNKKLFSLLNIKKLHEQEQRLNF